MEIGKLGNFRVSEKTNVKKLEGREDDGDVEVVPTECVRDLKMIYQVWS